MNTVNLGIIAAAVIAFVQASVALWHGIMIGKKIKLEIEETKLSANKIEQEINNNLEIRTEHSKLINDLRNKLDSYWYNSYQINNFKQNYTKHESKNQPNSLFSFRLKHFKEEKRRISEYLFTDIIENIKCIEENDPNDKYILLLDSGSTIYPVFEVLCNAYFISDNKRKKYFEKIVIITNNVAGANLLTEIGRSGDNITANMLFSCFVLPGVIEGKYNAVLSEQTASYIPIAINHFKENQIEKKEYKTLTIGVVTGNYISLEDGILTRGDYHDIVKQRIIENSDHLYIASPLGKFSAYSNNEINKGVMENVPKLLTHKEYGIVPNSSFNHLKTDDIYINKKITIVTSNKRNYKNEGDSIPDVGTYLNNILNNILDLKEEGRFNVLLSEFDPRFESEQVVYDRNIDKFEAILKYEFPHRAMRDWLRKEIENSNLKFT